jgi:hypothetical protein
VNVYRFLMSAILASAVFVVVAGTITQCTAWTIQQSITGAGPNPGKERNER